MLNSDFFGGIYKRHPYYSYRKATMGSSLAAL